MKTKTSMALLAAGIVSLLAFASPNRAEANSRHVAGRQVRGDIRELRSDRAELRRDLGELRRDRTDLRSLYRSGASRGDVAKKRAEIRSDLAEIRQDRREIRGDLGALHNDRNGHHYGWNNDHRFANRDRWNRSHNGRRGWRDSRSDRRWGFYYGRD